MEHLYKTILILGGDGYLGWPLALKLAIERPEDRIIIIDNGLRRKNVQNVGSESLIPISLPEKRIEAFEKLYCQNNLEYIQLDINSCDLELVIQKEKPHTIYHLAQQCSAPYSMKGLNEAIFTISNNEVGNMRLLWAVRKHIPDAHVIKLGSFGEYAKGGIDIAEGYFCPEYKGQKATKPMPFPREADDIYHVSKINDSNYVSMACRKWGLRITEVMQSTIFGILTEEMQNCDELFTRFDYDEAFGTVLNRFLTQVIAGYPLTVYGTGHQQTGLMSLKDSVDSLSLLVNEIPQKGQHRVINHLTECYSINELANIVKDAALNHGYMTEIKHDSFDPRNERPFAKSEYSIDTTHLDLHIKRASITETISGMLKLIAQFRERISSAVFPPITNWNNIEYIPTNFNIALSKITEMSASEEREEVVWEKFREEYFPNSRINLNPGTISAPSELVKKSRTESIEAIELDSHPLGIYDKGRESLLKIRKLCNELWTTPEKYEVIITHSTSQTINLLSLALLRSLSKKESAPYRIISTEHEHYGGIGVFRNMPEYDVNFLGEDVLSNEELLKEKISQIQPHLAFFSHVYYATGCAAPVEKWSSIIKAIMPECKIIIDAAQSLGLYELPLGGNADLVIASTHKWLFGPQGGGLAWIKDDFRVWIEGFYWCGHWLDTNPPTEMFSIPGGQDFLLYPGVLASLELYKNVGMEVIRERSAYLARYWKSELENLLSEQGIEFLFLDAEDGIANKAVVSLAFPEFDPYPLYKYMDEHLVHVKCIKDYRINGKVYHILRFGMPYFETIERLKFAIEKFKETISLNKFGEIQERKKVA